MTVREAIARPRLDAAARDAAFAFLASRALVWIVAVVAAAAGPIQRSNERSFDAPYFTHALLEPLLAPLARWDSVWYLAIAHHGYDGASTAFFPLYPLALRALVPGGSPAGLLLMGYVVSLAALLGALYLLRRLAEVEIGADAARWCVLLLAFFPGALWLGVPYSESLFLLLSVGSLYAARTGHWAWAGVAAGLASATRSAGIVLVVPLVMLWWRGRRRDLAWLALAPAGLVAYSAYLGLAKGDALSYTHVQQVWYRHFAGPFGGVVDGAVAAWDGLRQLASGSRAHAYFGVAAGDPFAVAGHNLELFAFLVFALVSTAGVWRRLPRAYGAYVIAGLALPLSYPVTPQPLMSLPRFLAVLFPLFMWLALLRRRAWVFTAFALLLGVVTARYATWHWVA